MMTKRHSFGITLDTSIRKIMLLYYFLFAPHIQEREITRLADKNENAKQTSDHEMNTFYRMRVD